MDLSFTEAYVINKNGDWLVESGTSANSTTTIDSFIHGAARIISLRVSLTRTNVNDTMETSQSLQMPNIEAHSTTPPQICLSTSTPTRITTTSVSLDILDLAAVSFPAAVSGLTIERPGLAARILGFNRLLKKLCSTSGYIGLGTPEDR